MDKINLKVSNLTFKGSTPEEKQKIEDSTSPSVDEEKSNAAKYAIGATALAAIVIGGIASKGKLWGKEVKNPNLKDLNEQGKNACIELTEEGKKIYTEFKENLNETIGLYAKHSKLNDELIIDGQKVVFSEGKLVKVIDPKSKEIVGDETLDLDFIKKLEQSLAKKFELETVVPNLKKEIKTATNIYKKHMKNARKILKDVEQVDFGKEITRKVGKDTYTLKCDKQGNQSLEVITSDGKNIKINFEDSTACMKIENDKYYFEEINGKDQLIKFDKKSETCNIGDITSYRIPYYKENKQAEVYYKMPHHYMLDKPEVMPKIFKDNEIRFFTDLKKYYSKNYLGA